MNSHILLRKKTIILCILFITIVTSPYAGGIVNASFTIEDEKKLGKEFYERLDKNNVLIRDPKITSYINELGKKILASSDKTLFEFHFSIIKSSAINAFATPGGYVYVNSGLINLVEKESELAGVLAHEIAHVNARHIASIIEKSQKVGLATLVAVLAGAFLGGGGDLTAAITGFSVATATSLNLKYSREHEEEADRLGMYYLVNAGYDGKAMLDFLKSMRRYEFYSNSIPSYFLTHPGTDERIRYLDALLQTTYTWEGANDILGRFKRIKTRLMFGEKNINHSLKYFQNELQKNPDDVDALYGLAVIQEKLGKTEESLAYFQRALNLAPQDDDIARDMGILYYKLGRAPESISLLRRAHSLDEKNEQTLIYLGRAYEMSGDYTTALEFYKKVLVKDVEDERIYYSIAVAYGKNNDKGNSHYYFGKYFKKRKNMESALFHFKAAQKYYEPGSERFQEIENEIESIQKKTPKSS